MTLKNGYVKCSLFFFLSQWMKKSKQGLFVSRQKKPWYMEKALYDWPIVLRYDFKGKYRCGSFLESEVLGQALFSPERHALLHPFDKIIKSLYFRSFVNPYQTKHYF